MVSRWLKTACSCRRGSAPAAAGRRSGQDLQGLDGRQDRPTGDVMIAEIGGHGYRHGDGYRFDGPGKVFHS